MPVGRFSSAFAGCVITPGYYDPAPFPPTPTKWTYRAIHHVGDQRVGQWSKPVTVLVG